jgi:hypothetical protein
MPRGGARPRAGRKPTRVLLTLDLRYARDLAALGAGLGRVMRRRSPLAPSEVVALLIEQAYAQLREMGDADE